MYTKILKYLALTLFSFTIFFSFGEMAALILYKPTINKALIENRGSRALKDKFDPLLGWIHIPNATIQRKMPGYIVDYKINAKGLRGQTDYPYYKQKDRERVVIIGDSFTFGHGVKEEDTYANQLKVKFKNTEVINMGVSGYSTAQQYLLLKTEGVKYNPDLVIIGLYITNIRRNLDSVSRPHFKLVNDSLILLNQLLHQGDSLTVSDNENEIPNSNNFFVRNSRFITFLNDKIYYFKKRFDPLPEYEETNEGWALLKALLLEIRKTAAGTGAETLIVLIPHHSYYGGRMSKYVSRLPFEQMNKFAAENDYYFIDLLPTFERYALKKNWKELVIEGDGHWNDKGHGLATDSIYQFILNNHLLRNGQAQ